MSESILACSGGHWFRAALTWTCLAVVIVATLPRSEADERSESPSRMANADAVIVASPEPETQVTVTHRVTTFDFNAAAMTAYGDTEAAEQAPRDR